MNNMSASIALSKISKRYGDTVALHEMDLTVQPGEFVALLGPSGAGKSTLFRCLTALERVDAGRVQVLDQDMAHLQGTALQHARRDIGLIFQQFNLIGRQSALYNTLAGRLGHVPTWRAVLRCFEHPDRQLALKSLERVGLLSRAYQRADSLSGGQQQRVAIARVLTQQSRVVLADEPVSSLDPESAGKVLSTLRTIAHEQGITVLCSLHQVEMAKQYADRIVGLKGGAIVVDTPAAAANVSQIERIYAN